MAQVEPMDIDDIESDFDNKENSSHHSNVLPRTPCMEKGYEELDVSELNMKLRYSVTPASSPMSKSLNDCENNTNNGVAYENSNLTRSLNSTITKSEMVTSLKSLPLQVLTSDKVIDDRNTSVLCTIDSSCDKNNVTISLAGAMDNDDNISLPSTSSSVIHTPEATTPTKETTKHDGGSPIMRGLKSVLNMFRSSQSPIPPSDTTITSVVKQDNLNSNDFILKDTQNNKSQTVVVSTPISNKRKEMIGPRRSSPLKESIVFSDDLEKDLQWKDETTIFFKDEKIPIHKLFPPTSLLCNSKNLKEVTQTSKMEKNDTKNITEEYMSMSNNASMSQSGNVMNTQLPSLQNEVSTLESDGEFVDCEMTIHDEVNNSKLTDNEDNTYEKSKDCNKFIQENTKQEIDNIEAVLPDNEVNKSYVLHRQCEVSNDVSAALNSYENILSNSDINNQNEFETRNNLVNETQSVVENYANQNEMIEIKFQTSIEHITPTNVILCEDKLKKYDVEITERNENIHPSEVPLPDGNNIDFMELTNSTNDTDKLRKMVNLKQNLNLIAMSVGNYESDTIEESYKHVNNEENEIKPIQVNNQEINIYTDILKASDNPDVTREIATLHLVDLQKLGECMENQIIDTPVNASSKTITTEINEKQSITPSVHSESSKKEDKHLIKIDNDNETETDKITLEKLSDKHLMRNISEVNKKNHELELKTVEKNNSDTVCYNVQKENSMSGEVTNSKFSSIDFCEDNLHFHENDYLSKIPNNSIIEHVLLDNCKENPSMLTNTMNEDNVIKAHSVNMSTVEDHQGNTTIGTLPVIGSEMHLDGLQDSTFDFKKQSATNTVEKYIIESMNQERSTATTDALCNKIDIEKTNKILNLNKGSNELLHLNNETMREVIEKEEQIVESGSNSDLTLSDKFTMFDKTYLNESNTCAMDTTFNMEINKEVSFENVINMDEAKNHVQNKVLSDAALSGLPGESSKKYEDGHQDTKIEEHLNSGVNKEHHINKKNSNLEVNTRADCLDCNEVNISDSEDIIVAKRNETVPVPNILNPIKRYEASQSEHSLNVNNSVDYNTVVINDIKELHDVTTIPSHLHDQDTLVETIEVFACDKEKKIDLKSFKTVNEVLSQEGIKTNVGSDEKETDSIKNNAPRNVFNLPEMSGAFISKLKDNTVTSPAPESDCSEHIFKVPSSDFTPCSQNSDNKTDDIDPKLCVDKNELDSSDLSASSKASEATVHEVNTEDEDTVEASFFETEEFNDVDKKSEHEDMIDFSDIPTQKINENAYKGEMFIDAEAFQFLLNQNKSNVVADSGRESLFLKFDPLFAKRMSSDAANVNAIQKGQITPKRIPKAISNIDFYRNTNETSEINSTLETNFEDSTVLLSKPMMVVNPAVNSVFSPRNKSSTPPRSNRRSHTFTSPAIAVIDRLLSLSGDNSALNHEMSISDARGRTNETDQVLTQLRELLAEKEINVHGLRSESKELTERLRTLESQLKTLEMESEQRFRKVDDLNKCLAEKTKMNKGMAVVVEEYERTIASLTAEIEQDKKAHAEERMKLINERNEQNAHLASMTMSFNDLHSKYEKNKQIILNCKANEEKYKRSIKEFDESVLKIQNNYELLKQHATSNLNNKNDEFEKLNRTHEAEILKYGAMIKRKEMDISSLKETLAQKIKANEELTAICDELLNKVA